MLGPKGAFDITTFTPGGVGTDVNPHPRCCLWGGSYIWGNTLKGAYNRDDRTVYYSQIDLLKEGACK